MGNSIIIHIHVPKTAGLSFLAQMESIYRKKKVGRNYYYNICIEVEVKGSLTLFQNDTLIRDYKVISGHFPAKHCEKVANAFRLTFLRHPIDNLLSCYSMVLSKPVWAASIVRKKNNGNGLSFREFVSIPCFRWLYTETFFGDFDMKNLDFVGDTADYDNELLRLGNILGIKFDLSLKTNVTSDIPSCPEEYKKDKAGLLEKLHGSDFFKEILVDDIAFYNKYKGK